MRTTRTGTRMLATAIALLAGGSLALAGCSAGASSEPEPKPTETSDVALPGFVPIKEDTLTVAVWRLPAPGDFDGMDPAEPGDGMGSQIAQQMAKDFGLSKVEIVVRNFAATTSGNVKDFDIAYGPSPTEERKKVAEFSSCFWSQATLIMTAKDRKLKDVDDLKDLQWGVTLGSVQGGIITNEVKPSKEPLQFNGVVELYPALLKGTIDAAVGTVADISTYLANPQYADFDVHAQIIPSDAIRAVTCQAMLLPKGSPNVDLVDESLQKMTDDGQIDGWYEKYYVPNQQGLNPADIPTIELGD